MDYPISVMQGEPCFDSLGVIKLRCEPSVPVNDRIFAQAQAGRTPELFLPGSGRLKRLPHRRQR